MLWEIKVNFEVLCSIKAFKLPPPPWIATPTYQPTTPSSPSTNQQFFTPISPTHTLNPTKPHAYLPNLDASTKTPIPHYDLVRQPRFLFFFFSFSFIILMSARSVTVYTIQIIYLQVFSIQRICIVLVWFILMVGWFAHNCKAHWE